MRFVLVDSVEICKARWSKAGLCDYLPVPSMSADCLYKSTPAPLPLAGQTSQSRPNRAITLPLMDDAIMGSLRCCGVCLRLRKVLPV
jgi:hypothetical protein